jgi:hypothetical protein
MHPDVSWPDFYEYSNLIAIRFIFFEDRGEAIERTSFLPIVRGEIPICRLRCLLGYDGGRRVRPLSAAAAHAGKYVRKRRR